MENVTVLTPLSVLRQYPDHNGTLYGLLESRSAVNGSQPFLIFDDTVLTWNAFKEQVDSFSQTIGELGIQKGDRIAIASSNSDRYIVAIFAIAKLGAICVPVNQEFRVDEIRYVIEHAQITGIIASDLLLATLKEACAGTDLRPWHISLDAPLQSTRDPAHSVPPFPPVGEPDDIWLVLYTSGTTGFPKGVRHKQRTFALVGETFVDRMQLQPKDRLLCILPLFHANALFFSLGGAIAAGASLVLVSRFSASNFWRIAAETHATAANIIAAVAHILAQRPESEFCPDHQITKMYAVPINENLATVFRDRFHVPNMIEGYGLSEAPGIITNRLLDGKTGSMGRVAQHPYLKSYAEIRLVDDEGNEVPINTPGEIIVRTLVAMEGYHRDPKQTSETFSDGWLRTGDLAKQDENGFYYFISRKKDIIRRRGENISAAELERIITSHPQVQDAAVIGTVAELGEEEVFAIVLPLEGSSLNEIEIADWCRDRVAHYKVPRYITLVKQLPYTPSHRVAKHKIKADQTIRAKAIDITTMLARSKLDEPQ